MALKADRYEESTDISYFSSATGVRGEVVCIDAAALAVTKNVDEIVNILQYSIKGSL